MAFSPWQNARAPANYKQILNETKHSDLKSNDDTDDDDLRLNTFHLIWHIMITWMLWLPYWCGMNEWNKTDYLISVYVLSFGEKSVWCVKNVVHLFLYWNCAQSSVPATKPFDHLFNWWIYVNILFIGKIEMIITFQMGVSYPFQSGAIDVKTN